MYWSLLWEVFFFSAIGYFLCCGSLKLRTHYIRSYTERTSITWHLVIMWNTVKTYTQGTILSFANLFYFKKLSLQKHTHAVPTLMLVFGCTGVFTSAFYGLFTGGEGKSPFVRLRQCSTTSPKHLRVPPLGSFVLLPFLPWPGRMGGARWRRKWTGLLLPHPHGAHHLGQPLSRLPHGPWAAPRRGALFPLTSSVACPFSIHRLPPCVDLRLGAVGGWEQRSHLLLQPDVWGDILGASRAAEPVSPSDGAYECAQVSRGRAGKDSLAALLSLSLSPVLASPRGKL